MQSVDKRRHICERPLDAYQPGQKQLETFRNLLSCHAVVFPLKLVEAARRDHHRVGNPSARVEMQAGGRQSQRSQRQTIS